MTTQNGNGHVHFTAPPMNGDDDDDVEPSHRKLDSPPPPLSHEGSSASPTLKKSTVSSSVSFASPAPPLSSIRSEMITASGRTNSSLSSSNIASKHLRGNLTRQNLDRDPLHYYEIVAVLGIGSMGSVAKVCKRNSAVGGSARKNVQDQVKQEQRVEACFNLPVFGGLFRFCLKQTTDSMLDASRHRMSAMVPDGEDFSKASPPKKLSYAMKSIHLSRVNDNTFVQELKNEVQILRNLDHPHIVRAIETYEHRDQIFLVMELCGGGDLYCRDPYSEEQAARITSSILSAILYMHSRGILHRDLKYENIMFVSDKTDSEVKLIDFGLSKKFGNDELTDGVGTIYTMAPEVLKGKYTQQADLWSVGVVAYMLLSSQMPFYGRKREDIAKQISRGKFAFKGRRWKRVSRQGKTFVEDLLVLDPEDRATSDEALGASWLNRRFGATVRNPDAEEFQEAQASLEKFASYSKLKKVALMVVAHKSTSTEIGILRKVFQQFDTAGSGHLDYEEFKAALAAADFSKDDCREIFDAVDMDGTGKIRYTEFLAATIEARGAISEERLAEAFGASIVTITVGGVDLSHVLFTYVFTADRLDADDSGYISADNLKEMLGSEFPEDEIDAIIKESGIDGHGRISYPEFLALWEDHNESDRAEIMGEISLMTKRLDSDHVSTLSGDDCSERDGNLSSPSRSAFLEGKHQSERSVQKHVVFQESDEIAA